MNNAKMISFSFIHLALAIACGAFGAHKLESLLIQNERLDTFETASEYHFYAAFMLICIGLIAKVFNIDKLSTPYILGYIGSLIFSFSLYLLSITNIRWLGAITPIGGLLLIISACWVAWKVGKVNN